MFRRAGFWTWRTIQRLKLLIDIPWSKHLCFLDSAPPGRPAAGPCARPSKAARAIPAVFAYSVVNELPPDIVRWSGARAVEDFLDELVAVAKDVDPECLCTFGNYPPTEFLNPRNVDFVCFNVYLHQQRPFENYLARLQTLADSKPLAPGGNGHRQPARGRGQKCEILEWQIESAFRAGLAGAVVFSFTDEWHKDEPRCARIGISALTTRDRQPKPSFAAVQRQIHQAALFSAAALSRRSPSSSPATTAAAPCSLVWIPWPG